MPATRTSLGAQAERAGAEPADGGRNSSGGNVDLQEGNATFVEVPGDLQKVPANPQKVSATFFKVIAPYLRTAAPIGKVGAAFAQFLSQSFVIRPSAFAISRTPSATAAEVGVKALADQFRSGVLCSREANASANHDRAPRPHTHLIA